MSNKAMAKRLQREGRSAVWHHELSRQAKLVAYRRKS
jgi:hypothetical protein